MSSHVNTPFTSTREYVRKIQRGEEDSKRNRGWQIIFNSSMVSPSRSAPQKPSRRSRHSQQSQWYEKKESAPREGKGAGKWLTGEIFRVPPMFVSIHNWTRRYGRVESRAPTTDSASEFRESVTMRREPRRSCTATYRQSMLRAQRAYKPPWLRMLRFSVWKVTDGGSLELHSARVAYEWNSLSNTWGFLRRVICDDGFLEHSSDWGFGWMKNKNAVLRGIKY